MAYKVGSWPQHEVLHVNWPKDCCLCRVEEENARLREALKKIAEWDDSVEAEDCPTLRKIAREAVARDRSGEDEPL